MDRVFIEGKKFENEDFTQRVFDLGDYEECTFVGCNFSEITLSGSRFENCEFHHSNLSLTKIVDTAFRNIGFSECKLLGLRFDTSNKFGLSFSFDKCQLDHCTFYQMRIKDTSFIDSQLHEVDFTECDLTSSTFDNCDLKRAVFVGTNLEKVDFRTAYNFSLDPEVNKMSKAKFSLPAVIGLLNKYNIIIENAE